MRKGLLAQIFLAVAAVSLLSVGISGLIARAGASAAFRGYLETLPARMGRGMGRRMVLGGAEEAFLAAVDRSIFAGALIALALGAVAALLLAYYLTRPLEHLTAAAQTLAAGDLTHRVEVGGPDEVQRLGEAFNEMAASLDSAEGLRKRLVADVAHELRNPLAALRAQVDGIAEGVLTADDARLSSIAEDARYLSRLIDDLQELSAAEAGALTYDMRPLDVCALARREAERAAAVAAPGVETGAEGAGELRVTGDEGRIAQVLRNLLANALRHTAEGRVTVSCARDRESVRVEVRDTGEGIPEADLPYVFERFYRADSARARDTGGTGIGLAVSRRIVLDHGGEVFARNAEGGGAVVGFTLPLSRD